MNRFLVSTLGQPDVERGLADTDSVLRAMFGDNAGTTEKMMRLADGSLPRVDGQLRGRTIIVTRKVAA